MIKHIVFFKMKDTSKEGLQTTKDVLMNMQGKIPQLKSIEVGLDVLHSERSYDVALITEFASLEDLQAYNVHPIHKEVIAYMSMARDAAVTVDFEF